MARLKKPITIDTVFGGIGPSQNFFGSSQYLAGIGVDPELPMTDAVGDRKPSSMLRPSAYEDFSGAEINANVNWFLTNPKNTNVYAYLDNGKVVSYTSSLGSETAVSTIGSSAGNGAAYYNNYLYFATNTDISRYGPLDGAPSVTNNFWTSTLSLTALTDTTYPSLRGSGEYPNHPMHVHTDNKLYIGDFKDGQGLIHWIRTSKTTNEGDTNNGSTYNQLDLPFGYMPTDIESFGDDIVISAIQTTDSTLNQGKSALFFYDTVSDSFRTPVFLPDVLATALLFRNGRLYIWGGPVSNGADSSNGYRFMQYVGGQSVQTIYHSPAGSPPTAGAVDSVGDRIVWGTFDQLTTTTDASPDYYAVVMAYGSSNPQIPQGVHCIANSTASGSAADGLVTALAHVQQDSLARPKFVIGHRDAGGNGIDKSGTTYGTCVWRSRMFQMGKRFTIRSIRFSLGEAVGSNMTITPTVFLDDFSSSSTSGLTVVNDTNYTNSERSIQYYPDITGNHNFCLELKWSGSALLPVMLPITIEVDIIDD